jgi:hypothetical protein
LNKSFARLWPIALALVVSLTACSSSSGQTRPTATQSAEGAPTALAATSTTSSASPPPTQTVATTVQPGDTVFCKVQGAAPAGVAMAGTVTVSRWVSAIGAAQVVSTIDLQQVLPGWTAQGTVGYCGPPTQWSADFSKLLIFGNPPGSSQGSIHIAIVDTLKGTFQDLTAPRQQTGFSSAVLADTDPQFLSDAVSSKITFGSKKFSFIENGTLMTSDIGDPSKATPVTAADLHGKQVVPGHPEQSMYYGAIGSQYNTVSPDGTLVADPGANNVALAPASRPDSVEEISCPNVQAITGAAVLGWVDSSRPIVGASSLTNPGSAVVDIVSLGPGSAYTCKSLIPDTDKTISNVILSPDSSEIFFTADGPSGPQVYSVASSGSSSEPALSKYPVVPDGVIYYRPGNY